MLLLLLWEDHWSRWQIKRWRGRVRELLQRLLLEYWLHYDLRYLDLRQLMLMRERRVDRLRHEVIATAHLYVRGVRHAWIRGDRLHHILRWRLNQLRILALINKLTPEALLVHYWRSMNLLIQLELKGRRWACIIWGSVNLMVTFGRRGSLNRERTHLIVLEVNCTLTLERNSASAWVIFLGIFAVRIERRDDIIPHGKLLDLLSKVERLPAVPLESVKVRREVLVCVMIVVH